MLELIEKHIAKYKIFINLLMLYFCFAIARLLFVSKRLLSLFETGNYEQVEKAYASVANASKTFTTGLLSHGWLVILILVSTLLLAGYYLQQWYYKAKESKALKMDLILAITSAVMLVLLIFGGNLISINPIDSLDGGLNIVNDILYKMLFAVLVIAFFHLTSLLQTLFITDFNLSDHDLFKKGKALHFLAKLADKMESPVK